MHHDNVLNFCRNNGIIKNIVLAAGICTPEQNTSSLAVVGKLMDTSGFTGLAEEILSAVAMVENLYIWGAVIS